MIDAIKLPKTKKRMAKKPSVNLSFKKKKKRFPFQVGAAGMKVQGPSHEEGGVPAVTQEGEQVAEIEGGERIFSVEDTKFMEGEAKRILSLMKTNQQAASDAARALGFKIVEMLINQEKSQREQEGDDSSDVDQAANEFAQGPDTDNFYSEQPD